IFDSRGSQPRISATAGPPTVAAAGQARASASTTAVPARDAPRRVAGVRVAPVGVVMATDDTTRARRVKPPPACTALRPPLTSRFLGGADAAALDPVPARADPDPAVGHRRDPGEPARGGAAARARRRAGAAAVTRGRTRAAAA